MQKPRRDLYLSIRKPLFLKYVDQDAYSFFAFRYMSGPADNPVPNSVRRSAIPKHLAIKCLAPIALVNCIEEARIANVFAE